MVHLFMAKLFFYEGAPEGTWGDTAPLSGNPSPPVGENLTIRRGVKNRNIGIVTNIQYLLPSVSEAAHYS